MHLSGAFRPTKKSFSAVGNHTSMALRKSQTALRRTPPKRLRTSLEEAPVEKMLHRLPSRFASYAFLRQRPSDAQKLSPRPTMLRRRSQNLSQSHHSLTAFLADSACEDDFVTLRMQLSELEAAAVVTVMEEAADAFGVLELPATCNNDAIPLFSYLTPEERFDDKPLDLPLIADRRQDDDMHGKTVEDGKHVSDVLVATVHELLTKGTYTSLQNACLIPVLVREDERNVISELGNNGDKILAVKNYLKDIEISRRQHVEDMYVRRCNVLGQYLKLEQYTFKEDRYMDKWIDARLFQHRLELSRTEETLKKKVTDLENKIKHLVYAHENVRLFSLLQLREMKEKAIYFAGKHNFDVDTIETDTYRAEFELKDVVNMREEAEYTYSERTDTINEVKAMRAKRLADKKMDQASRKIQKWWRKMYRKVLAKRQAAKKGKKGKKGQKGQKGKKGK